MRIVATLTSIPSRIDSIKPLLENVLKQTVSIDCIEINIPSVLSRTGEPYCIPEWMKTMEKVSVFRTKDYGPITKILPTLLRYYNDESTYLWQIDDDIIYESNHLEIMMQCHDPSIFRILARHGGYVDIEKEILTSLYGCQYLQSTHNRLAFIEGFGSILYPPKCVNSYFFDYVENVLQYEDCIFSDDIILSYYFALKNVPMYLVNNNCVDFYPKSYNYSGKNALMFETGTHAVRYQRVADLLISKYPNDSRNYLDLLKVYSYDKKFRLGCNSYGGYVIADIDIDYDCYISAGIKDEESFSRDFIKKYNMNETNCFGFDGTISKYPYEFTTNISFVKKNIASFNDANHTNLHSLIHRHNNIFLKMDIEGGEYPWILSLNEKQLDTFAQIAIEFHGINDSSWNSSHTNKIECFKKLQTTHYIIHAHANNDASINSHIPNVIEFTYVNKRYFKDVPELNNAIFPIDSLDYPNVKHANQLSLYTYPFVNLSYLIRVNIGKSNSKRKTIRVYTNTSETYLLKLETNKYPDSFKLLLENQILTIERTDVDSGWDYEHNVFVYKL